MSGKPQYTVATGLGASTQQLEVEHDCTQRNPNGARLVNHDDGQEILRSDGQKKSLAVSGKPQYTVATGLGASNLKSNTMAHGEIGADPQNT